MSQPGEDFFIGWQGRTTRRHGVFLAAVAAAILAGMLAAGFLAGRGADDPAETLLRLGERDATGAPVRPEDWGGEQTLRGLIVNVGTPLLLVTEPGPAPRVRTYLLSGDGKRGAAGLPAGGPVEVRGSLVRRGSIEMFVVDAATPLATADTAVPAQAPRESLGTWRIAGEICDGKCVAGAMRPGAGLSHRACAQLCLIGEIPAVFVTAAPVAGSSFLVLVGADNRPPPAWTRDLAGIPVRVEGTVERIGNALVLRATPDGVRRL